MVVYTDFKENFTYSRKKELRCSLETRWQQEKQGKMQNQITSGFWVHAKIRGVRQRFHESQKRNLQNFQHDFPGK